MRSSGLVDIPVIERPEIEVFRNVVINRRADGNGFHPGRRWLLNVAVNISGYGITVAYREIKPEIEVILQHGFTSVDLEGKYNPCLAIARSDHILLIVNFIYYVARGKVQRTIGLVFETQGEPAYQGQIYFNQRTKPLHNRNGGKLVFRLQIFTPDETVLPITCACVEIADGSGGTVGMTQSDVTKPTLNKFNIAQTVV